MKVTELLHEAKSINDFRHTNTLKDISYWPAKEDPQYIDPEEGFHFAYNAGDLCLFSTNNLTYSKFVSDPRSKKFFGKKFDNTDVREITKNKGRDLWNQLSGLVNFKTKLITISKESAGSGFRQRVISDVKEFQQALKNLKNYGVSDDFKIKGTSAPFGSKTVGEVLLFHNPVDRLLSGKSITMYHGTSVSRAETIKMKGLRPNEGSDVYIDLIKGYSEFNVYLATDPKTAEFYGKRQANKDGDDEYVVFKIDVPDPAKIVADDSTAYRDGKISGHHPAGVKGGIKEISSVGYKGRILPKFISVYSKKKA